MEPRRTIFIGMSVVRGIIVGFFVMLFGGLQMVELRSWWWGPWQIAFGGWFICYMAWRCLGRIRTVLMNSAEVRDHGGSLGVAGLGSIIRRTFWLGLRSWWSAAEVMLVIGVLVVFEWTRPEGPGPLAFIGVHACGLIIIWLARRGMTREIKMS